MRGSWAAVYFVTYRADLRWWLIARTEGGLVGFMGLALPVKLCEFEPVTNFSGPRLLTCENATWQIVRILVIRIT